jgi:hypothetical protein
MQVKISLKANVKKKKAEKDLTAFRLATKSEHGIIIGTFLRYSLQNIPMLYNLAVSV